MNDQHDPALSITIPTTALHAAQWQAAIQAAYPGARVHIGGNRHVYVSALAFPIPGSEPPEYESTKVWAIRDRVVAIGADIQRLATLAIRLPKSDATGLFDNASAARLRLVDQAASVDKYNALLTARVQAEYPGASVEIDATARRAYAYATDNAPDTDTSERYYDQVLECVRYIGESAYDDQYAWIVEYPRRKKASL